MLFPNQTIPVLPEGHWATTSGEIWVPVDHNEKQNSQLVFAVYSNLDILFGNEVESDFMTINLGNGILQPNNWVIKYPFETLKF